MNSNQLKRQVIHHLAERGVPANTNPWEALKPRIDKNQKLLNTNQRPDSARPGKWPQNLGYAKYVILFMLVLAFILFAGSRDRALARSLLRFFAPASHDLAVESLPKPSSMPTSVDMIFIQPSSISPTRSVSTDLPGCSDQFDRKCSLQQAQTLVDFQLMRFSDLPNRFVYKGTSVEVGRVSTMYGCSSDCLLWLEQAKAGTLPATPATVGSSASIETVAWKDIQGEYVEGSYYGKDGGWNSRDGVSMLRWQQGDTVYTISVVQSQTSTEGSIIIMKDDLIRLASSMTTDLLQTQPLNPLDLASISDARILAGFDIVEPESLPEGYDFSFATYEAQTHFVCLNYAYHGASYPSLFIRQSPSAALTKLNGYPGSNLHTELVVLAGADGNAQLVTGFAAPNGACDTDQNIFRAGQALLWQTNGMNFEIYAEFPVPFSNAGLEQNELIHLAESMMRKP